MKKLITFTFESVHKYIILLFSCLLIVSAANSQTASNEKKQKSRMYFQYFNNADNTKTLKTTLFYISKRMRIPITNQIVFFYLGDIAPENLIDSALTDNEGIARLNFDSTYKFPSDEERYVSLSAQYNGSNTLTEVSDDIRIKEISMELFLTEVDKNKMILARAYELGNAKELYPLKSGEITFYIPRLFGDQKIGQSNIDEGKASLKYPTEIAGDSIGNLSIIARLNDTDEYGNVERILTSFRWGNKKPLAEHKSLLTIQITIPTRGLWHSNAPLWMIITLIVLLTGVWSHYLYVIFQLIKLARLKKNHSGLDDKSVSSVN